MTRRQGAAAGIAALVAIALLLAWLMGEGTPGRGRTAPSRDRGADAAEAFPPPPFSPPPPPPEEPAPEPEPSPRPPFSTAPEVPEAVCVLEGIVLDLHDAPVPGARISWGTLPPAPTEKPGRFDPFAAPRPAGFSRESTVVSGGDGTFVLKGPPCNRVVLEAAVEGGRVEPFGPFRLEGDRKGIVLRVAPATFVEGVVLRPPRFEDLVEGEEDPPPTPQAGVRVIAWNGRLYSRDVNPVFGEAISDAAGRFRIDGVPPEEFQVNARAEDGAEDAAYRRTGATGDVRLLLQERRRVPTHPFEGTVLLSDGSTPAGGASIEVRSSAAEAGAPPVRGTSAPDGSFRIGDVPWLGPGKECPLGVTVHAGTRGVVVVAVARWPLSGPERIVLWPPAFRTIEGRVVNIDAEGDPPLPGLPLEIRSRHEDPQDPRIGIPVTTTLRTRTDGSFAAAGHGVREIRITVPPGEAPFEVVRALEEDGIFRVEVVPACTLEGTVRTVHGEAVEGALCSWNGTDSVLSDAEGRFRFFPVPGNRTLFVVARVPGFADARSLPVTVPPGGAVRDLLVVVDAPIVTVSGRVVDAQGEPLPLARVEATDSGRDARGWPGIASACADGEGFWRLDLHPGGPWRITASAPGLLPDFVDGVGGGRVRDLRLLSREDGK